MRIATEGTLRRSIGGCALVSPSPLWLVAGDVDREMMIHAALVRQGDAQVATFPPEVTYQDPLLTWPREAREAGREWWGTR
jgi:hypothetical protein